MGKIYFASDFHLGVPTREESLEREKTIVRWLDMISEDAEELYLVGDVFDFWFEYSKVVPKGFVRILGKLAELRDSGLPIYFFIGNHDMWMFNYFEEEFNIPTYRKPIVKEIKGKKFMIGHGDGLGPSDKGYKRIKKIFANPFFQWCFARLHPNFGIRLAKYWSGRSRESNNRKLEKYEGKENEWLYAYSNKKLDEQHIDYFIFGHRHLPLEMTLKNNESKYFNLGEWMRFNSYAEYDGENLDLKFFEKDPVHYQYS